MSKWNVLYVRWELVLGPAAAVLGVLVAVLATGAHFHWWAFVLMVATGSAGFLGAVQKRRRMLRRSHWAG